MLKVYLNGGEVLDLKLHVVDIRALSLFGRDWLCAFFNPDEVFDVFNLPHQYGNEALTDLLSNYDVLFEKHFGKLNKITGKLYLKNDAKPVFCRAAHYRIQLNRK